MKSILALALLSTSLFYSNISEAKNNNNRIVGGEVVDPAVTETRYIVSIGGGCAGSIIAPSWILTAAHCKSLFTKKITGGSVDLNSKQRVTLEVKKSYIHPKNNAGTFSNDFALLELKKPINFETTGLTSIAMVDPAMVQTGAIDDGEMSTVLGWGAMGEYGSVTNLLRMVDVPFVSRERANALTSYNGEVDETMIAAGFDEGQKDSCQGDSGGPLVIDGSNGKPVLAGVVSWGQGCARARYYGIYANVSVGYSWIMETISR